MQVLGMDRGRRGDKGESDPDRGMRRGGRAGNLGQVDMEWRGIGPPRQKRQKRQHEGKTHNVQGREAPPKEMRDAEGERTRESIQLTVSFSILVKMRGGVHERAFPESFHNAGKLP